MEDQSPYGDYITRKKTCSRIIICSYCKGKEKVRIYNDNPAYEGPWMKKCPACEGSGRRVMNVMIEYKPFNPESTWNG